jgi:hypothetical protein
VTDRLAELKAVASKRRKLCPICQRERDRAAIIRVELRRSHPEGKGAGEQIDSKQLSVCEDCAADVWPQIRGRLPL